ncbi:MAG: glycosyltransferase [Prolixibacteraceae bacterium]|nr:glycosyltransferase [Prolixibacteraceae bacterium]
MNNHCVFYRTNLKYDGRVCAIIRTLAISFPNDTIYLYEYPLNSEIFNNFPKNVKIIKARLVLDKLGNSHLVQHFKAFEYGLKSLFFLLRKKPKTIQVHHEIVALGPLLFKKLRKNSKLIYDDKEFYHLRDKNIPKITYWIEFFLINKSNLVISCNRYRLKALKYIHKNLSAKHLIIDNFVFSGQKELSPDILSKITYLKGEGKKILLHQGIINKKRGLKTLIKIAEQLSDNWLFCFIGIKEKNFQEFYNLINRHSQKKLINLGYIDYEELNSFYIYIDASVVIYDSSTFNNKHCAPNRLYSAVNNGKPIIVNSDNRTLSDFIKEHSNGIAYESPDSVGEFERKFPVLEQNSNQLIGKYLYDNYIPSLKKYYKEI